MSDSSKSILARKRERLTKEESGILTEIEGRTSELNTTLNKTLKTSLIIGGGLLAGYVVYKAVSGKKEKKKTGIKTANKKVFQQKKSLNPLLSFVLEKGFLLLIDSLKNKTVK